MIPIFSSLIKEPLISQNGAVNFFRPVLYFFLDSRHRSEKKIVMICSTGAQFLPSALT